MAESEQSTQPNLDPEQYLGVVRAALDPDERKFFKAYLGQESPDIGDYLSPQGRFAGARRLREHITTSILSEAIKQSQAPTLGEAQALFPNFPTPPSAHKTVQGPLMASDEMPVLTGTQQTQMPDNRFQGPMPGVLTPLGRISANLIDNREPGAPFPLNAQDRTGFLERTGAFYEEAPRPLRTITTGVYGPDTAPSQASFVDPTTKLPPAFQAQLGSMQHQLAQRQLQPHYPSAEDRKYDQALQLGIQAWMEEHDGQQPSAKDMLTIQQRAAGGFEKAPLPGSAGATKLEGEAKLSSKKADAFDKREQTELADIEARTNEHVAKENEIRILMDAKERKLLAEAKAAEAAGSKENMSAYFKEQMALLGQAKEIINLAIELRKSGKADDASYSKLISLGLASLDVGVKAEPSQQSWFDKTFLGKKPVDIVPTPEGTQPRRLTPPRVPGFRQAPLPQTQTAPAPEEDDTTALRSLGMSMKDGEVKSYKGQKYRRKGGKLEKVN